jgi:hypothetical protein
MDVNLLIKVIFKGYELQWENSIPFPFKIEFSNFELI